MASLSTESTPRERLARQISVLRRVRMYWRSTAAIAVLGVAISLFSALRAKRAWRSEATILYRDTIQTQGDAYAGAARAARLGPKLKDMLTARSKLSRVIEEFGLYPRKASRSMVEAVAEMQLSLGFRARDSDTYVISFVSDDPATAQRVTARLADLLIEDYRRENLDSATMTHDFLRRELADASARVDEASRALATFLAKNPQFQWGVGDSPYAPPQPAVPGAPPALAAPPAPRLEVRAAPRDPELASLERRLAQVDAELSPPRAVPTAPQAPPATAVEALRARDAAAAAAAAAEAALAERLQTVKPVHPDAIAAKGRVQSARRELAAAEAALQRARAGVAPPSPAGLPADLSPERRAELEESRDALIRQIAARRARVAAPAPREARAAPRAAPAPVEDSGELATEWHRRRLEPARARDYLRTVQANERAANMRAEAAEKKSDIEMAILDPAYLPTRAERGRGRVFIVGALLSLLFAFGLAGARVLLDDTLYDEGDLGALGGPPLLVAMPQSPGARERALTPAPWAQPKGQGPAAGPPGGAGDPGDPDDPGEAAAEPPGGPAGAALDPALRDEQVTIRMAPAGPGPDPFLATRARSVTLRFGSPILPPPAPAPARSIPVDPGAALTVIGPRGITVIEAEPEVEEIDGGFDLDGVSALELVRGVPPPVLAALRVLRHRLDQRRGGGEGDGRMVVAVVSPGPQEGKTALAVRLALTLAEAARARVVLVEGNLERPRVAASLGLRVPPHGGLTYQLRRRMLGERRPLGIVRVSPTFSVVAEPRGSAVDPGVLHSPCFGAAIGVLRRAFDYVVIDGPAVLGAGDANVLEEVSDGVLLVARVSVTRCADLSKAAAQLGPRRILGVVLNDVTRRPAARKKISVPAPRAA
ncbi:MAG: hypothetical protein IT372_11865 [Polyangiaceae bacterium]|nr:hypothetical protein [Polyangiaceae bacterium]